MLFLTEHDLFDALRMARWQETPAVIQKVESVYLGEGGSITHATYHYEVNDQAYTGLRVAIGGKYDTIGSFQTRVYQELTQHQALGRPFRCFVNPENPAEAILYRATRWEMIFVHCLSGLLLFGSGGGVLAISVKKRRRLQEQALQIEHPQTPWLVNRVWADGVVRDNNRSTLWFALGFALFWNALSTPIVIAMLDDNGPRHNPIFYVMLLFPTVGIGLLIWVLRVIWRRIALGTSLFRMTHMPGVIGGELRGTVEIPAHIQPVDGFRVTLRCMNRVTTDSGEKRVTQETVLWESERLQAHETQDGNPEHVLLPVLFIVPRSCRPTDSTQPDNQIIWRLEVKAANTRGPRYSSRFEVPMFVTADSTDDVRMADGASDRYGHAPRLDDALRDSGIRVETRPDGVIRYTCPPARDTNITRSLTLFWVALTGQIVAMALYHVPLLFPIVFGLVDLLIFFIVLIGWFEWHRIEFAPDGVRISGGLFGLAGLHHLNRGQIVAINVESGGQTKNHKTLFVIRVRTNEGCRHTICTNISGRQAVDIIAADISSRLGLPPPR